MIKAENSPLEKVCKWYPACPLKKYYERGEIEEKWIDDFCKGDYEKCVRYQMEEAGEPHPDNMLPNGEIRKNLI